MNPQPVFGFLALTSGSFEGAIIRDMRLANELHRRGFRVVVYWMVQQNRSLVDPAIPQRVLCSALRYRGARPSALGGLAGRAFDLLPAEVRVSLLQTRPRLAERLARNLCNALCDGGRSDPVLVDRLARMIRRDGVTHLLPTFAFVCPLALAARRRARSRFDYLVTFQGEELFANYALELGRIDDYRGQLRESVENSPWKAIAVSEDYIERLRDEMQIDPGRLTAVFPGIELPPSDGDRPPFSVLRRLFPGLREDVPIVAYVGRNDAEKGIDLFLYALRILRERGVGVQPVIVGGTTFGAGYQDACRQIAAHLRLEVHWGGRISGEVRDALYAHARCVVYPPIHREPFGMVAAEALSHGTPVLVSGYGGITEAIRSNGACGGLTFRVWDSGNLAQQLERLVSDGALHARLARDARAVAAQFGVRRLADRVLAHMGLPVARPTREPAAEPRGPAEGLPVSIIEGGLRRAEG